MAVWVYCLARWLYRKLTYEVRLSTRRVIVCRGFLLEWRETSMRSILKVDLRQNFYQLSMGIGRVVLTVEGAPTSVMELPTTAEPQQLAERIRRLAAAAK
jgi:hypothetical protein